MRVGLITVWYRTAGAIDFRGAHLSDALPALRDADYLDGVIAVQPEVASLLVGITGPFTVQFQSEEHHITTENVYAEIDWLYRRQAWTCARV